MEGIPLFSDPKVAKIVLDSLAFIQTEWDVKLYGFVIMENHIHAIVESETLSEDLRKVKSYTAKKIIESLEDRGRSMLLDRLKFSKRKHKKQITKVNSTSVSRLYVLARKAH